MGWSVSGNIKGPQGDDGDQGDPGPPILVQGDVAAYGNLPGGLGTGDAGKAWLVLADGKLYEWSGSAFPSNGNGTTCRGPQGTQGVAGEDGAGIEIAGSVATYGDLPDDLVSGDAGDGYLVEADGKLYIWTGSAFPADGSGVEFRGPQGIQGEPGEQGETGDTGTAGAPGGAGADGARGSLWYTGTGTPSGIGGAQANDQFLDTATGDVYTFS